MRTEKLSKRIDENGVHRIVVRPVFSGDASYHVPALLRPGFGGRGRQRSFSEHDYDDSPWPGARVAGRCQPLDQLRMAPPIRKAQS